jgi:hypothetical protein
MVSEVGCIVDNVLVRGETTIYMMHMCNRCYNCVVRLNFKLNKIKVEFRLPDVKYVGHLFTHNGSIRIVVR